MSRKDRVIKTLKEQSLILNKLILELEDYSKLEDNKNLYEGLKEAYQKGIRVLEDIDI